MTITTSTLTRAAGMSAVLSGLLYIVIQPIHPDAIGRYAAVPVGLAMVWLGWSLRSEQRTSSTPSVAQRHGSDRNPVPAR